MKKRIFFVLLLVLFLLPISVFAMTEEEVQAELAIFGLAPGNQINPAIFVPTNYEYEGEFRENFKMITIANNLGDAVSVSCDSLYSNKEAFQYGNYWAYKAGEHGVCYMGDVTGSIPYDIFNQEYKNLYGVDAPKQDISFLSPFSYLIYDYNEDIDSYVHLNMRDGMDDTAGMIIDVFKIRSINEKDDTLSITVASQTIGVLNGEYTIGNKKYKDMRGQAEIEASIYSDHIDELNTYEVVLKKKNDHYVLKSINKVGATKKDDAAGFSSISIYAIGIALILFVAFLGLFIKKTNKIIREV